MRLLGLLLLLLVSAGVCLFVGPVADPGPQILFEIRLPRIVLAVLVGAGLAGSGAVLQGILRNPLADPFILGTSSAAAAGVLLAGLLGFSHYPVLYASALAFAFGSIHLVYRIARTAGKTPVQTLILAGVVVSLFFNAVVFVFFSVFFREQQSVFFFLLGTLTGGDRVLTAVSGAIITAGLALSWLYSRELDLLTQGEAAAFHLGVEVERAKRLLFFAASAVVAAAVAAAGMIGFVGLIVPHMMRMTVGPRHRGLIPASALGGAIVLVLADALARTLAPPLEIPVGALTALLGSPYFIYLLRRRQRAGAF